MGFKLEKAKLIEKKKQKSVKGRKKKKKVKRSSGRSEAGRTDTVASNIPRLRSEAEAKVDEHVNVVMKHIKKAIRSQIYAESGAMTARSIVNCSKYGLDEVHIVGLAPILKPIDEGVIMPL